MTRSSNGGSYGWRPASLLVSSLALSGAVLGAQPNDRWVVYPGGQGPGAGKHVVLVAGDDEYRSEEALPMLGRILAERHGFRATVLFPIDPESGEIKPDHQNNIPGLEALESADMLVLFTRFRELPDEQMKYLVDYVESGQPVLGLRTATHGFFYRENMDSPYASWSFNSEEWPGGFGQQVLGDTWIAHHGNHGKESTRGIIDQENAAHPILRGVSDVWGPTDVYALKNLPADATVLLWGQTLDGMTPDSEPVEGEKNDPMVPVLWTREYPSESGRIAKVVATTMGASVDLVNEGLRRALINAVFWATGLEVPDRANVLPVGSYEPTMFGFGSYQKGLRPEDFR